MQSKIGGVLVLLILFSSCVGKDCSYERYPQIEFEIISSKTYDKQYLIGYDATSFKKIDSISFEGKIIFLNHYDHDLRNVIYYLHLESLVDTITNVNYEIYDFYNECNSGFLNNKGGDATDFKDLQFELNGQIIKDSESIKINH
ncbi:MAG: hypothetical protein ACJAZ3_000077 [Sphingobacteriales bacterium]|jgi:hypothetical protein